MDLNTLAQETLELSENIRKELLKKNKSDSSQQGDFFSFDEFNSDEIDFLLEENAEHFLEEDTFDFSTGPSEGDEVEKQIEEGPEELPTENLEAPEGPGILFRVDKGISTFCLRGLVSEDLHWDLEAIERQDVDVMRSLKIDDEEQISEIRYFMTEDYPMAETVSDQLINRRFPRQEAMLCNISDPGFSWWMKIDGQSFNIYFQSHGIERDDSLIQLGPLGDPMIAYRRLGRALSSLRQIFPVSEYSATDKFFEVSCTQENNPGFEAFSRLFTHGEFVFEEVLDDLSGEDLTLFLYLREIAAIRRLWLRVQKELE
jgi:hypothetical protein